jgi:hypothetical protein
MHGKTYPLLSKERHSAISFLGTVVMITPFLILLYLSNSDLGPLLRNHISYWRISANLPDSLPSHPVADIAARLRECTGPRDPIFIAMTWTQSPMLFFSKRYLSGIAPVYAPNILTSPEWQELNRERIAKEPPKVIVVNNAEWAGIESSLIAPYISDLIERWKSEYTSVIYRNEYYTILSRPFSAAASQTP